MPSIRNAGHAGSWYSSDQSQLKTQLKQWLDNVPDGVLADGQLPLTGARAIISPHAGYAYSGPAAAWAYKSLDLSTAKRIFILHPSHHYHLRTAALPVVQGYLTPLAEEPLLLDLETIQELSKQMIQVGHQEVKFSTMSKAVDEAEHSAEMQLPYIHYLLQRLHPGKSTSAYPPLVPIMVGAANAATEKALGKILAPYIADKSNVFVISSDFCHWGSRFSYTYYLPSAPSPLTSPSSLPNGIGGDAAMDVHTKHDWQEAVTIRRSQAPKKPTIHESIAEVDRACMCAIATGRHDAFLQVIQETENTVCGRHPIGVFMAGVEELESTKTVDSNNDSKGKFRFMCYERSSDVADAKDSSVSYVSAFAVL